MVGRSGRMWSSGLSLGGNGDKDFHRWQNIEGQTHSVWSSACWSVSGTGPAGRPSGEKFGYLTVGSGAEADQGDSLERRNRTERSRCLSGQALVGSLAHSEIVCVSKGRCYLPPPPNLPHRIQTSYPQPFPPPPHGCSASLACQGSEDKDREDKASFCRGGRAEWPTASGSPPRRRPPSQPGLGRLLGARGEY